ncbi:MAG: acyltransferase [Phycisphaerales bacterium]|jgi:maltose O-acetyltransferase
MRKLCVLLYYVFVSRLPGSRFSVRLSHLRRWYVSKVLGIMAWDAESEFQNNIYIGDGSKVRIGKCCKISENVFLQGGTIGDYVMIGPNTAILTKSHQHESTDIPMVKQGETEDRIPVVEDDVWIGRNAIILPGLRIGAGSIVGAGAVVTSDVPPYSVVGGVPARIIRKRIVGSPGHAEDLAGGRLTVGPGAT